MAYPTVNVNTTNLDVGTDNPALARTDILDLAQKFNLLRPLPADLASSSGSSLSGHQPSGSGAIPTTVLAQLLSIQASIVNVKDAPWCAKGDGTTDDTVAIQAAINHVCNQTSTTLGTGGGRLFFPPGNYRITSGLYVGYSLLMEGTWGGGFAYVGANSTSSTITCDFGANINQWAIDSNTFMSVAGGGGRVPYNAWVTDNIGGTSSTGFSLTAGLAIKNLVFIDKNTNVGGQTSIPYGCIRLVGCPNALIENVSIYGFGVGLQLNTCFGTKVKNIWSQTNYYGFIGYEANNNIIIEGEFDKVLTPSSLAVPTGNIPSWMASNANFAAVYALNGATHNGSSKGVMNCGTNTAGSNGSTFNVTLQYWGDSVLLINTYANLFNQLYIEGTQTQNIITSAYASYNVLSLHNYSVNTAYVIDAGYNTLAEIDVTGANVSTTFAQNVWTSGSALDTTQVTVHNLSKSGGNLPSAARMNKAYEEGIWNPAMTSTTGALTTVGTCVGSYTKVGRNVTIEFDCTITTNGTGSGAIQIAGLPYLPRGNFNVGLGRDLTLNKTIVFNISNGVGNVAWITLYDGTYPGTNGARLCGSFTYQS